MQFAKLLSASVLGASAALSTPARAAVVIQDGFEYANQAAYDAVWPGVNPSPAPNATLDLTRGAGGSGASVTVPGLSSATTNNYRSRQTFADTDTISLYNSIVWSFDFYDSAPTGAPQRNYANLQDNPSPNGTNQLIAMGFNNNQTGANSGGQFYMARILGYSPPATDPDGGPGETGTLGGGAFFKLNDFGVGARSAGWHNLKVVISTDDGLSADYAFYVDGDLAERVNNVGSAATAFRAFDNITIGSGFSNGNTEAGFDNMYLAVVPEPTSIATLGLGATALLRRRRRSR